MTKAWLPAIRVWWERYCPVILWAAVGLMTVFALEMLVIEFWHLVWDRTGTEAIDIRMFHDLVQRWFSGGNVYGAVQYAQYPPASYLIFWPFLGWLPLVWARALWAVIAVVALVWLSILLLQQSGAETSLERVFVVLLLLSMNATGVLVTHGQLLLLLLPMLLTALLILQREERGWLEDLVAAALLLAALIKPSITVPFFWLVLISRKALRPMVIICVGYVVLTVWALQYQEAGFWILLSGWLTRGTSTASQGGYGHVSIWMTALGLKQWMLPASLLVLLALGVWVYRHRRGEFWTLLGVTAIVARMWIFHRPYDDLLLLLPMIALYRIAKRGPVQSGDDVISGLLLAGCVAVGLMPMRLYYDWPPPWPQFFEVAHVSVWIAVLAFLLVVAWRERATLIESERHGALSQDPPQEQTDPGGVSAHSEYQSPEDSRL